METMDLGMKTELRKRINIDMIDSLKEFRDRVHQIETEINFENKWNNEERVAYRRPAEKKQRYSDGRFQNQYDNNFKDRKYKYNENHSHGSQRFQDQRNRYGRQNTRDQSGMRPRISCYECGAMGWRWRDCMQQGPCRVKKEGDQRKEGSSNWKGERKPDRANDNRNAMSMSNEEG